MMYKNLNKILKCIISPHIYYKRFRYLYRIRRGPSKDTRAKIDKIRQKNKIKVAFILYDLAKWKSESLYCKMLEHPRFEPILVVVQQRNGNYLYTAQSLNKLIEYLNNKQYKYIIGKPNISLTDLIHPDLVFWGEPYKDVIDQTYSYYGNKDVLSAYIPYCFHNSKLAIFDNIECLYNYWILFYENQSCIEDLRYVVDNRCTNAIATGLPINDAFLTNVENPWKMGGVKRKRVIWAPSHTIQNMSGVYEQSTFLTYAESMLILAEKYKEYIQWAFKPHPVLKRKLIELWGYDKTENYYKKWNDLEYSQLEEGAYVSLFMHSDAMIHDSLSFIVEYMFTEKPVLFLENGKNVSTVYNRYTKEAYDLHYHGINITDIEEFLKDLIIGKDYKQERRIDFKKKYLIPPHNKTANENIIDAILGNGIYKNNKKTT